MSKQFKSQDYFRYKKLGKRWRKPVGWQSKLRLNVGGAGRKVRIGYGTAGKMRPTLVRNMADLDRDCRYGIIIASAVGSKKASLIAAAAKERGLTVLNMRKVKRAKGVARNIEKKKAEAKKEEKKEKKAKVDTEKKEHVHEHSHEHEEGEHVHEHEGHEHAARKMGFHESVVPQVTEGNKTKTYRIRDHKLNVDDDVAFENTQKGEIFGHAKITKVERMPVSRIDLKDPGHHKTYDKVDELIAALKRHNPSHEVTPDTEVLVYTYKFNPKKKENA